MLIDYCVCSSYQREDSMTFFLPSDPFRKVYEAETMYKYGRHDPAKPPMRERGDIYIILGALVGLIIGGVVAAIISYNYLGIVGIFLSIAGGAIAGGIIGATAGNFIKKWRRKVRERKYQDSLRYQG